MADLVRFNEKISAHFHSFHFKSILKFIAKMVFEICQL